MISKPALIAFIITVKLLTLISIFYEYNLTAEEMFKNILIIMLGITFLTIAISAIFICLLKLQQRLNDPKNGTFYLCCLHDDCHETLRNAVNHHAQPLETSLESLPSYNKAVKNTCKIKLQNFYVQPSLPPPAYSSPTSLSAATEPLIISS